MRTVVAFVVPFAVAGAGFAYGAFATGSLEGQISSQKGQIEALRQKVSAAEERADATSAKAEAIERDTGVDRAQVAADEKVIREFLSDTCVWSNFDEYAAARDRAARKWGLDEESPFMSKFMPKFEKAGENAGNPDYNYVDAMKLNMSVDDVRCYLSGIGSDGTYRYLVEADLGSVSQGKRSSSMTLFVCEVDGNGKLVGVEGVVLA